MSEEIEMNILDAFIQFNNKMTLVISGLPGSGKLKAGKMLSAEMGITLLKQSDYIKKGFENPKTLSDGSFVNDYNTDSAIDWERLNKDIKQHQVSGVVVVGVSFPQDKLKKHLHINLNISRTKYLENVNLTQKEKLMFDELIYPYYNESVKNAKINKFINANELDEEQLYDSIWNTFMEILQNYIKWFEENRMDEVIREKQKNNSMNVAQQSVNYLNTVNSYAQQVRKETPKRQVVDEYVEYSDFVQNETNSDEYGSNTSDDVPDGVMNFANPYVNPEYIKQLKAQPPYLMLPQFSRYQ